MTDTANTKRNLVARVYATIRKRDIIRQGMLDNNDQFLPWAKVFMRDMGKFCYIARATVKVSKITGSIDPIAMAVAEGRREAFMHMMELLRFSDENALKTIEQINQLQED